MTELTINGQAHSFDQPLNIKALLAALDLADQRLAVECNGEIVPRSRFDELLLQHGDHLEIVIAVGGG